MPRLIAFEHRTGMRLKIDGRTFDIIQHVRGSGVLTLKPQNGDPLVTLSTSELAGLLVQERAEHVDELVDPDPEPLREFTDITHFAPHRAIDWFCKMYLVRKMHSLIGQSPKSKTYQKEYQASCDGLTGYLDENGLTGFTPWSKWTIYHNLLRFQFHRFDIASLQKKGVEYCGYQSRSPIFSEAAALAQKLFLQNPHRSKKAVADEVNEHLDKNIHQGEP